jgi:hypothetical protein
MYRYKPAGDATQCRCNPHIDRRAHRTSQTALPLN